MSRLFVLSTFINLLFSIVISSGYYNDDAEKKIAWANTALTGRLLYNQLLKNPGQSHSVATLPILTLIAQAALHSKGNEFQKLAHWLNLNNKEEIRYGFSTVTREFADDTGANMTFSAFGDVRDCFSGEFKQNFKDICDGDLEYVDYSNVHDSTNRINFWFKKQYDGLSGDVIGPGYLRNHEKDLVFGTYMETKTSWNHPFNPKGLVNIKFYKSIHEVKDEVALYGNAFARYAELPQLNAKMLMLSSNGIQDSIVWLYPNDPADLLGILYKTQDPNVFYEALSKLRATCLKLEVTVGQSHSVNRYPTFIPELNLPLSGLYNVYNKDNEPTGVHSILQQLHLVADKYIRDGPVNTLACPDYDFPLVKFDHPFAYFSLNKHKTPIFAGVYYGH